MQWIQGNRRTLFVITVSQVYSDDFLAKQLPLHPRTVPDNFALPLRHAQQVLAVLEDSRESTHVQRAGLFRALPQARERPVGGGVGPAGDDARDGVNVGGSCVPEDEVWRGGHLRAVLCFQLSIFYFLMDALGLGNWK